MSADNRNPDFESQWQEKLSRAVESAAGTEVRDRVLQGGENLTDQSTTHEKVIWTHHALGFLADAADLKTRQEVLTSCHCSYPIQDLQDVKQAYKESGQVDLALEMLQEKFELFLREVLHLEEELVSAIIERGWGLAGVREGDRILATKIPKSGYLREYFQADDPLEKRRLYCHCPRVRDHIGTEPSLPPEYCYCGAGFYQGIWEEILEKPVQVEVLESVMAGGDVCRVAVHLPTNDS